MIDGKKLEELAKQVTDSIPQGVRDAADNLESRVKQTLQQQLGKLDVVTREDLEIQQQMVLHMRQRIDALEAKLDELKQAQDK
ncbi:MULTISPECIES: accessory factor UbiK family protein [Gammaproteobacteria]|uniref:accessory factor UbiK family protein n=1 Tax=Gammaproteobacteria TaxID=1236 RepID=UPI000DD06F23|nr:MULTISPECIES: accessory factor UbiK family protein [Gammaproteobacteria]RTE86543.1 accessory factor UbiK family protein [Aliidiomarina sp. B3213]TCZ90902.1 accessory factor UbiK family protein [Lysobacter sp. N42]